MVFFGKKKARSSRASQHAAASPKHDSPPNTTHAQPQSSSQSSSTAERGNGRRPSCDVDEHRELDDQWKEHINEFHLDRVLFYSRRPDPRMLSNALNLAYDNIASRIDNRQQ